MTQRLQTFTVCGRGRAHHRPFSVELQPREARRLPHKLDKRENMCVQGRNFDFQSEAA